MVIKKQRTEILSAISERAEDMFHQTRSLKMSCAFSRGVMGAVLSASPLLLWSQCAVADERIIDERTTATILGIQVILGLADWPKPVTVPEPSRVDASKVDVLVYPKFIYYSPLPSEMLGSRDYPYAQIINEAALANNIDPMWMYRIAGIESGYSPRNQTGSYRGLFQLSYYEFQRHSYNGNIYDARDNANAAARMFAEQRAQFMEEFGRYPDETEAYMIHQQGIEGACAHLKNLDAPAWENMHSTGEGQQRGSGWSRLAIWGNLPPVAHQRFGNVDAVTSRDFVEVWRQKVTTGSWPMSW